MITCVQWNETKTHIHYIFFFYHSLRISTISTAVRGGRTSVFSNSSCVCCDLRLFRFDWCVLSDLVFRKCSLWVLQTSRVALFHTFLLDFFAVATDGGILCHCDLRSAFARRSTYFKCLFTLGLGARQKTTLRRCLPNLCVDHRCRSQHDNGAKNQGFC